MARTAKTNKTTKPAPPVHGPGRSAAKPSPKTAKATATSRRASAAPATAPKVSKDDLRAQVEKLERANATLRTKSRDATRAAKLNVARIAELEDQVAKLERQAASETATAKRRSVPARPVRSKRQNRDTDPGDTVPPDAATQEPAAPDKAAALTREHLEENLAAK